MAEFMPGLQFLRPPFSCPSSFPFLGMDPNLDLLDHSNLSFHVNSSNHDPVPSIQFGNHETGLVFPREPLPLQPRNTAGSSALAAGGCDDGDHKRKKPLEFSQGSCSASGNSPDPAKRRKHGSGGKGRRTKGREEEEEDMKKKEVVHVRARRGQATDSHSLAERVRRGKINERLRCLQDIVPGCYKTMGLAVMLDEIISYVHSLQNQVEFLSMKLTAASSSYDFNSGSDVMEAMMQRAKACEAKELERLLMRGQLEAHSAAVPFNPPTYNISPQPL